MSDFSPSGPISTAALAALASPFAGGPVLADVAIDRPGPVIDYAHPPAVSSSWASACSFRDALCVHAPSGAPPSLLLAALSSAERAWDVLDGALALPLPDVELDGAWHIYLVDDVPGGGRALLDGRDPRAHYDGGTSFALVDRSTPPGCGLDLALARALTRAAIWRAAPGTDEASADAQTEALARLAVPCADRGPDTLEFQSHPERALADPSSGAFDRGASLFFDWLDATFAREAGGLLRGLWALAPGRTPAGAWRWSATPTGYDVLRESLKGALSAGSTIDDVFVRFAVERARATPPVRIAWHIPWPERARRLAPPRFTDDRHRRRLCAGRGTCAVPARTELPQPVQSLHHDRFPGARIRPCDAQGVRHAGKRGRDARR